MLPEQIHVSNALLRDYCRFMEWRVPAGNQAFQVGLRNAVPHPSDPYRVSPHAGMLDRWDDTLLLAGTTWGSYCCTTDPGRPYTDRPMRPEGAAWLVPGVYRFKIGRHKSLFNNALVQAGPVRVRRDRDRDGRPEYGELVEEGEFGIHVHRGGTILRAVGKWSAGCTVLPIEEYRPWWAAIRKTGQTEFDYAVFDALLLSRFYQARK